MINKGGERRLHGTPNSIKCPIVLWIQITSAKIHWESNIIMWEIQTLWYETLIYIRSGTSINNTV